MYSIQENDGFKSIEIKFNTEDGEEWYLCTSEHTTVYDAFNELNRMELTGLDTRQDRVRFAEHVHQIKVHLGFPSPGPLPRLYQQVQWKVNHEDNELTQYNALDDRGKLDHNGLCVQVYHNGTVKVTDSHGMIHKAIFNYPGATIYEKFLNIPTIFPNVE